MQPEDNPKPKHAGGRPPHMTATVLGRLKAAFALDVTVEAACAYAGIKRDVYFDYAKLHPEFRDEVADLRETPYLRAVQTVVANLKDPDFAMKYLERKRKREFSLKTDIDITSNGESIIPIYGGRSANLNLPGYSSNPEDLPTNQAD